MFDPWPNFSVAGRLSSSRKNNQLCGAVDTFNGTFKNGAKDVFHDGLDRL